MSTVQCWWVLSTALHQGRISLVSRPRLHATLLISVDSRLRFSQSEKGACLKVRLEVTPTHVCTKKGGQAAGAAGQDELHLDLPRGFTHKPVNLTMSTSRSIIHSVQKWQTSPSSRSRFTGQCIEQVRADMHNDLCPSSPHVHTGGNDLLWILSDFKCFNGDNLLFYGLDDVIYSIYCTTTLCIFPFVRRTTFLPWRVSSA